MELADAQAPALAGLPVQGVATPGTDNTLYRFGESYVMRLPRRPSAVALLKKEVAWLPLFSDLPLKVPEVYLAGCASQVFGHDFAIFRWLNGGHATPEAMKTTLRRQEVLARFLKALHEIDTTVRKKQGRRTIKEASILSTEKRRAARLRCLPTKSRAQRLCRCGVRPVPFRLKVLKSGCMAI